MIVGVALLALTACSSNYDPNNPEEAKQQCQGFADQRLKAPATADYNLTARQKGGEWVVSGTVDSENGFGAKIRTDVVCRLHMKGDTAYLDGITIS